MKNYIALLIFIFTFAISGFGQSRNEKLLIESDKLFKNFYYSRSIEGYKELLQNDAGNVPVMLKIAEAYTKLHNTKAALLWYETALSPIENRVKVPVENLFNYAEVLAENSKYDEALKWYQLYKESAPNDNRAAKKIETISNRFALSADSMRYDIRSLSINSKYSDFGPAFYDSGIVFASAREEVSKKKRYNHTNSAFLDFYYSKFQVDNTLSTPQKFDKNINNEFHEGSSVFYDNDKKMIFSRNINKEVVLTPTQVRGEGEEEDVEMDAVDAALLLQLFYTEKGVDGKWKAPVSLSINDKLYSMGHPTISKDGSHLYFSSNIPGSYGGTDIYVSEWVDGRWSKPTNLGADINTNGNEMFPFLHQDSILYFSSNGHGGLGGLDIFSVSLNKSNIVNVGYPLNTQNDDFSIILNESGKMGYFSSNRMHEENDDLYQVFIKDLLPKEEPQPELLPDVYYTVQILALINPITVRKSFLKRLRGVLKHDGVDGFHRYTYGTYSTPGEAELILDQIKAEGYKDAFIRKVEQYKELSRAPGVDVEEVRKKEQEHRLQKAANGDS